MLRRLGGLLISAFLTVCAALPAFAIDSTPSVSPKIDGPMLISGYSFSGHTIRYVQLYNSSDEVVSIDGWKIIGEWPSGTWTSQTLSGMIAPKNKITVADKLVVNTATFTFNTTSPLINDARLTSIRLIPPATTNWLEQVATISINDTNSASRTPRIATTPDTFYFARNVSSSTGNFLSTYTAFIPSNTFTLESDNLYEPPLSALMEIVEVYPNPSACSPADSSIFCKDYVKIHNPSSQSINLSLYRLRVGSAGQSATSSNTAYISQMLAPDSYALAPISLTDSGGWVWFEDAYGITQYDDSVVQYPSSSSRENWAWSYNRATNIWQWTQFPTPSNEANKFSAGASVNDCKNVRISEIAANVDEQFIEVFNPSGSELNLSGCQLQTNRSATASYRFSDGTKLGSNEFLSVPISSTSLSLTKTTSGTVYVLNSDASTEVDARYYENLDEGTSFALVGGVWQQTFLITPNEENQYAQYPPCDVGYVRNLESGRCNKIEIIAIQKPCLPTQYRNPQTGRCKNLTTSTIGLKPCLPNQYRNLTTNRCRNIASTISALKPCGPNQERNKITNRCRNIVKTINADFPVEAVAGASTAGIGWWAFGGVGLLAIGYAGWEWRYEAISFIRKIGTALPFGK